MSWARAAAETIARVHAALPADIPFKDRKAAIQAAYPFGMRKYLPYKTWLRAQRKYLRPYDPKAQPPLLREMLGENP